MTFDQLYNAIKAYAEANNLTRALLITATCGAAGGAAGI